MIVYNHMQAWIYALPDLSGNAKLLLQRMVSLSKDGEQSVFVKREDFARQLGFAAKTVSRAFIELTAKNFIEEIENPNKWNRVKHFRITSKTLKDLSENTDTTDLDKMSISKETICLDRHGQNDQIDMDKKSTDDGQSVPLDLDKMSTSSLDRSLGRTEGEVVENAREKINNDNAPALNDIPLPDDSDFYETEENKEPEPDLNDLYGTECTYNAQEPANLPQTTNYTSNTNNTPSMQSSNEIEGVRRQLTIPSSADELIPLIEKFKAAHKAEKVFDDLDVRFYAGKIFDYYAGADGVWRDNKGNEVPPYRIFNKISSWIVNDQMNGKLHRIISGGTMTSADLSKAMDEIAEKNKREKLALMQKFGIKPPPIDVSCEEVENDENNNEPKLLEAK